MQLERSDLTEPHHRGQIVAEEVIRVARVVGREVARHLDKWRATLGVFLEELLATDPVWKPNQRQRTIQKVGHEVRCDRGQVAEEVPLRERSPWRVGPEFLI